MILIEKLLKLSVAERIQLAEDLWDSIVNEGVDLELPESQRQELENRLQAHLKHPEKGVSWEELKTEFTKPS